MVWALALGGMQDVGQNGPEAEVNPLIDNGFMYTSDGWGTIYKIDARNPNKGEFVWTSDSGVRHEGNLLAEPRHRAVGRPGDRQPAGRPRDRAQPRHRARSSGTRRSPAVNEFGTKERFNCRAHSPPRAR